MNLKHQALSLFAAAMLAAGTHAVAAEPSFAGLSQVDAQALSTQEMQSVTGQLNAYQTAANLTEEGDEALANGHPRIAAVLYAKAAAITANAATINAFYQKLGVYTPYP